MLKCGELLCGGVDPKRIRMYFSGVKNVCGACSPELLFANKLRYDRGMHARCGQGFHYDFIRGNAGREEVECNNYELFKTKRKIFLPRKKFNLCQFTLENDWRFFDPSMHRSKCYMYNAGGTLNKKNWSWSLKKKGKLSWTGSEFLLKNRANHTVIADGSDSIKKLHYGSRA